MASKEKDIVIPSPCARRRPQALSHKSLLQSLSSLTKLFLYPISVGCNPGSHALSHFFPLFLSVPWMHPLFKLSCFQIPSCPSPLSVTFLIAYWASFGSKIIRFLCPAARFSAMASICPGVQRETLGWVLSDDKYGSSGRRAQSGVPSKEGWLIHDGRQITLSVCMWGVYHPKVSGLYPGREPLKYLNRDRRGQSPDQGWLFFSSVMATRFPLPVFWLKRTCSIILANERNSQSAGGWRWEYFREGVSYSGKEMGKEKVLCLASSCDWGKTTGVVVAVLGLWRELMKETSQTSVDENNWSGKNQFLNYPFLELPYCWESVRQ